jgi:Fur family transcriptional regulator, ferric uptake regulator
MRNTRVTQAVTELLRRDARPFTIQELHARVCEHHPRTAYSTVYRVLARLEQEEKVNRVDWRERGSRFEWADLPHHHHIVCGVCGDSTDVSDVDLGFSAGRIRDATGFIVGHHSIELEGTCPDCQA